MLVVTTAPVTSASLPAPWRALLLISLPPGAFYSLLFAFLAPRSPSVPGPVALTVPLLVVGSTGWRDQPQYLFHVLDLCLPCLLHSGVVCLAGPSAAVYVLVAGGQQTALLDRLFEAHSSWLGLGAPDIGRGLASGPLVALESHLLGSCAPHTQYAPALSVPLAFPY